MYYIIKISDTWAICDSTTNKSRVLEKEDVNQLKNLFPALLNEAGSFLQAVEVTAAPINKLTKLSLAGVTPAPTKKTTEQSKPPANT